MPDEYASLKVGDKIRRLKDGRKFRVTFTNYKAVNCPVFSAEPIDGKWSGWGGPVPYYDEIEVLERLAAVTL